MAKWVLRQHCNATRRGTHFDAQQPRHSCRSPGAAARSPFSASSSGCRSGEGSSPALSQLSQGECGGLARPAAAAAAGVPPPPLPLVLSPCCCLSCDAETPRNPAGRWLLRLGRPSRDAVAASKLRHERRPLAAIEWLSRWCGDRLKAIGARKRPQLTHAENGMWGWTLSPLPGGPTLIVVSTRLWIVRSRCRESTRGSRSANEYLQAEQRPSLQHSPPPCCSWILEKHHQRFMQAAGGGCQWRRQRRQPLPCTSAR